MVAMTEAMTASPKAFKQITFKLQYLITNFRVTLLLRGIIWIGTGEVIGYIS